MQELRKSKKHLSEDSLPADIRTRHLPNTDHKRSRSATSLNEAKHREQDATNLHTPSAIPVSLPYRKVIYRAGDTRNKDLLSPAQSHPRPGGHAYNARADHFTCMPLQGCSQTAHCEIHNAGNELYAKIRQPLTYSSVNDRPAAKITVCSRHPSQSVTVGRSVLA